MSVSFVQQVLFHRSHIVPESSHACFSSSAFHSVGREDQLSLEHTQKAVWDLLVTLPPDKQYMLLSGVFDVFLKKSTGLPHVPDGFIQLAIGGMNYIP